MQITDRLTSAIQPIEAALPPSGHALAREWKPAEPSSATDHTPSAPAATPHRGVLVQEIDLDRASRTMLSGRSLLM
jgi:hypothetical protein